MLLIRTLFTFIEREILRRTTLKCLNHICICMYILFQRIAMTVNTLEQKRLLMDLDVSMRSGSCPFTVQFYGALFREVGLQ